MLFLEIAGLVWMACMAARLCSLAHDSSILQRLFATRYTKTQATWVTLRWFFLPQLLASPATIFVDGLASLRVADLEELKQLAIYIDRQLQERAGE